MVSKDFENTLKKLLEEASTPEENLKLLDKWAVQLGGTEIICLTLGQAYLLGVKEGLDSAQETFRESLKGRI